MLPAIDSRSASTLRLRTPERSSSLLARSPSSSGLSPVAASVLGRGASDEYRAAADFSGTACNPESEALATAVAFTLLLPTYTAERFADRRAAPMMRMRRPRWQARKEIVRGAAAALAPGQSACATARMPWRVAPLPVVLRPAGSTSPEPRPRSRYRSQQPEPTVGRAKSPLRPAT